MEAVETLVDELETGPVPWETLRTRYGKEGESQAMDLIVKGKAVSVGSHVMAREHYDNAKREVFGKNLFYLPLLKPNSPEYVLVHELLKGGKLVELPGDYVGLARGSEEQKNENLALLAYQFRKKGYIDASGLSPKARLRFERITRVGSAHEVDGFYFTQKFYQEIVAEGKLMIDKDWILASDEISTRYSLPYTIVAQIILASFR